MMPSILLLDCSSTLTERLRRQGFDVSTGTIGFCTGIRQLPCQVYEKDVIIYNPSMVACGMGGYGYISKTDIRNCTPEYDLIHLHDHILRGATILIFVNYVAKDLDTQNQAYKWIPLMPLIGRTKDERIHTYPLVQGNYKYLAPIISETYIKKPVLQKLFSRVPSVCHYIPLLKNLNNATVGVLAEQCEGRLIIMPECQSNEDIINTFLNRVIPKLYDLEVRTNLIDKFESPEEGIARNAIQKTNKQMQVLGEAIESENEKLSAARRKKIETVKKNEIATRILNYHNLAMQQEDVALFYLYKIIEVLEKKFGGEKEAKGKLGCNIEWNLIGKVANASYADIRHAPKPGERIREWTQDEIDDCFKAAEKIIHAYLATLF
jgi:hypothetical protein